MEETKSNRINEILVSFTIEPRIESAGIRIKSTSPTGLYVSSKDASAAQWYFETEIVQLLMRRRIITLAPGEGISAKARINWNAAILAGNDTVTIARLSPKNAVALMKESSPVIMLPVQKLAVDWWNGPHGDTFCMIRDKGNEVDKWLVDSIIADIPSRSQSTH